MKCGYSKCKFGGNVEKEDGIKVGNRWFHHDCNDKRELKQRCSELLSSVGMISKLTNSFLSKMIDDESCDGDYLEFVINHVVSNNLKLSNPFGIKYYMADYKIEKLYAEKLKLELSKDINKNFEWDAEPSTNFIPPKTSTPSYLKIL